MLSGNLPDELVVEILSRTPAKSLVKFKAVSKSWRKLLRSFYFVAKHRDTRAAINNKQCLLSCWNYVSGQKEIERWVFLYREKGTGEVGFQDANFPSSSRFVKILAANAADGIFCISKRKNHSDCHFLWNPSIRKSRALPAFKPSQRPYRTDDYDDLFGLGFDFRANEVKVVRTFRIGAQAQSSFGTILDKAKPTGLSFTKHKWVAKAAIWTSSNNSWRELDVMLPTTTHRGKAQRLVYVCGKCYWYIVVDIGEGSILCFDIASENFRLLPLPEGSVVSKYMLDTNRIVELKKSIGFISFYPEKIGRLDIWMMSDEVVGVGGGQVHWSKFFSLRVPFGTHFLTYLTHALFIMEGEVIFVLNNGKLFIHNLVTGKTSSTKIRLEPDSTYVYKESLVSFKTKIKVRH